MKHVIDTVDGEETYTPERWAEVCKGTKHATLFRIESQNEHGMVIAPVKYFQPARTSEGEVENLQQQIDAGTVASSEDIGRVLREQASMP